MPRPRLWPRRCGALPQRGLVGCTIEDTTGDAAAPVFPFDAALARIEAGVAAARALPFPFTLTARAENFLHGRPDLGDTIARLKAFEAAGADVLYAPGLPGIDAVRAVCDAIAAPVNVIPAGPLVEVPMADLAAAGRGTDQPGLRHSAGRTRRRGPVRPADSPDRGLREPRSRDRVRRSGGLARRRPAETCVNAANPPPRAAPEPARPRPADDTEPAE